MDKDALINAVLVLPAIRAITMSDTDKRSALEAQLPSVIDKILYSYDWDFAIDEASTVTVADQSQYILKGNSNDCRDIINVRYGDDLDLLDKMSQTDFDEWNTDRSFSGVRIWVPDGIVTGYPRIKIYKTPTSAGETIQYRYRRNDITLSEFPDNFSFVFQSGLVMRIVPAFYKQFKDDLGDLIKMYNFGGGEDNQVKQDPLVTYRNNLRSNKFGWG